MAIEIFDMDITGRNPDAVLKKLHILVDMEFGDDVPYIIQERMTNEIETMIQGIVKQYFSPKQITY
jgi:hypothetical protein